MGKYTDEKHKIAKHYVKGDAILSEDRVRAEDGANAGSAELYTPQPLRHPRSVGRRLVGGRALNMLGRADPISGALSTIEVVLKSDKQTWEIIPRAFHKVNEDDLPSEENPTGLELLSPAYTKPDVHVYPSVWTIEIESEAHPLLSYYNWQAGTEPNGAIAEVHRDGTRLGLASYVKELELVEEVLTEGDDYLTWHATLAEHVGNRWMPLPWSSGCFPANWDHVSQYRFAFSLLPFSFGRQGWFSWVCNSYTGEDRSGYAILKYVPSESIRVKKQWAGGEWPTEFKAQEMPARILDYSAGRALCDTRDITFDDSSQTFVFSGNIELWHVDSQTKIADIWPARVSDMQYDNQGFGIDKAERVVSATISNDTVVLLTAQNSNVVVGDMIFVAPDGGWADTTKTGEAWSAGLDTYWDQYIAMTRSGTYIWLHEANAIPSGTGRWLYPAGPPGYVNLFLQTGPYQWEFDRVYRVYVYDINSATLREVTLPGVTMRVHLRRNGGQINGTWSITGGPTWKTCYLTWFDAMTTDLTVSTTAEGLYISGRSGSRTILHPLTDELIGVQSPEHVCAIINANDGLLYIPLNYVEHSIQETINNNSRLYCFGLIVGTDNEFTGRGYVKGPRNESDGICFYNYKYSFVQTSG